MWRSLSLLVVAVLVSCDKGYRVRFANYYTERMDTIRVGQEVFFTGVPPHETTAFRKIDKGKYEVWCVSSGGRHFQTVLDIPPSGSGDRTIQIDAASQVSILEK